LTFFLFTSVTIVSAVLWDLDGTLVDSADYHWIAWRDTMASEGYAISYQQFLDSFGQKNDRFLPGWLGGAAPAETVRRIGDAKEAAYRRLALTRGLSPLPGAADWVKRLRELGWKQAIASSAPRENVRVMAQAIGIEFAIDAFVGAEDVSAGKPDPEVFLTAADRLGVPPSRCIVVEDAAVGVEAAKRAGMKCIGVSAAKALDADVVVRSLIELSETDFAIRT
jgi:HAD superfamily hydrolase (TIGR01509 family)